MNTILSFYRAANNIRDEGTFKNDTLSGHSPKLVINADVEPDKGV
jgi:hypothetical protein